MKSQVIKNSGRELKAGQLAMNNSSIVYVKEIFKSSGLAECIILNHQNVLETLPIGYSVHSSLHDLEIFDGQLILSND